VGQNFEYKCCHADYFILQGELFEILEDDKCLPEEQVQAIAKQLVFPLIQ